MLVVDMAIFSTKAACSDLPIEIPWSEWGPNKMAYALPQDHTPEPGQRLEELPAEGSFYVHIWDFNRAIARSERSDNVHNYHPPGRLIRRPGRLAQSCLDKDDGGIVTNHPYSTVVCPTGFSAVTLTSFSWNRTGLPWHGHRLALARFRFRSFRLHP